jgi:uncharacterized membrane protein
VEKPANGVVVVVAGNRRRKSGRIKALLFAFWVTVVSVVALWQSLNYDGVMAIFAEWQFNMIGLYYPSLTYVVVIAILTLPGYLLFLRPRQRDGDETTEAYILRSARSFLRALIGVAAGLGLAGLALLFAMSMLPTSSGVLQRIALDKALVALPREGLTELNGAVRYDRVVAFDTDQGVAGRSARYAPIVAPGSLDRAIQFFVELPPVDKATRGGTTTMTGILKKSALPGEVVQLYRYAGYRVETPFFVLHSDAASLRRPYLVVVTQLVIGILIALILAGFQWRRVRRLYQRSGETRLSPA